MQKSVSSMVKIFFFFLDGGSPSEVKASDKNRVAALPKFCFRVHEKKRECFGMETSCTTILNLRVENFLGVDLLAPLTPLQLETRFGGHYYLDLVWGGVSGL